MQFQPWAPDSAIPWLFACKSSRTCCRIGLPLVNPKIPCLMATKFSGLVSLRICNLRKPLFYDFFCFCSPSAVQGESWYQVDLAPPEVVIWLKNPAALDPPLALLVYRSCALDFVEEQPFTLVLLESSHLPHVLWYISSQETRFEVFMPSCDSIPNSAQHSIAISSFLKGSWNCRKRNGLLLFVSWELE